LEETFKEFMELIGQPTIPASQEPSLEDALETFSQTVYQPFQEITDVTVVNTEAIARLEGQLGHLVTEFNIIEEEEFQSHEMWR
jgi:sensor c-di-GMP phosphodiesterase-like protein